MEKMGLLKNNKMGEYEKEHGHASYRTIIDLFAGDIVLCNEIINADPSVWDNMEGGCYYINTTTGEEVSEEEYNNDTTGEIEQEFTDIYQYYVCNLSDYEKERLQQAGVILSYSDLLSLDVICVDHWGTSWDYVLTNVKLFDTYEELKAYGENK